MNYSVCLFLLSALLSATTVNSHMVMIKPPTIRWEGNPNTVWPPNYDIKSPLLPNGSNFPCQGTIELFDTPQGASVETWRAGSIQTFVINGTSPHDGGSCQASISEDNGVTFKVIKTFIGGCPVPGKEFSFTVPKETKSGKVIFAWTWFAHTSASPEMYMNCAAIAVSGPGGSGLSNFPDTFVANVGNGCTTPLGDTMIPNPGGDVETASNVTLKIGFPVGGSACPAVSTFVSSTSTTTTTTSDSTSASATSSSARTTVGTYGPGPTSTSNPDGAASAANSPVRVSIAGPVLSVVFVVAFSIFSGSLIFD